MLAMDLVITPDAMPAHLAATLGLPTWVMLEQEADWRWMQSRDDSPWYPTMRLFRQRTPGDWHSVATEIASQLALFKRVPAASGS
jgi:ADP-heptose:LPS heptosyltransferase